MRWSFTTSAPSRTHASSRSRSPWFSRPSAISSAMRKASQIVMSVRPMDWVAGVPLERWGPPADSFIAIWAVVVGVSSPLYLLCTAALGGMRWLWTRLKELLSQARPKGSRGRAASPISCRRFSFSLTDLGRLERELVPALRALHSRPIPIFDRL